MYYNILGNKEETGISLTVENGDIYGFIGHNGAGKSTTIRAVVGVLDFDEGDILIDGHSVKKEPLECKKITAYIPDNPDLYEHLTGIQYLNFIADIFNIDGEVRKEKIKKYGDLFEITLALGNLISSYSHGMKQKVAIISALIHEPKLMVLDEPWDWNLYHLGDWCLFCATDSYDNSRYIRSFHFYKIYPVSICVHCIDKIQGN